MSAAAKPHPFWNYSLSLYARAGVESACLALQEAGADVNLLLLCCWLGSLGRQLDSRSLEQLRAAAAPWQTEVVSSLRRARRAVKRGIAGAAPARTEELRRAIFAVELDAEYLEQILLADQALPLTAPARGGEPAAEVNLGRYLGLLAVGAATDAHARALLAACVDGGATPG